MAEPTVEELHVRIQEMASAHRLLAFPLLLALHRLGGSSPRKDVIAEIGKLVNGLIADGGFEELRKRGRLGFTRAELKRRGFIAESEAGTWTLTAEAKMYMAVHAKDPIIIAPFTLAPLQPQTSSARKERVPASNWEIFALPMLEVLATGKTKRKEVFAALEELVRDKLLPGDYRKQPGGTPVWSFRAAWKLSELREQGHVQNFESGHWRITDAGRQRLKEEKPTWDPKSFSVGYADVVVEGASDNPAAVKVEDVGAKVSLDSLRPHLGDELVDIIHHRLRPDLGASPTVAIKRNLIFYGPPGTGKTHVAKLVARALTGDEEGGSDGQFRIVQFHPSYTYEDFVQGLKPDLTKTELRYKLCRGPFLEIVEAARAAPNEFFVLVIDEINRGDPARIFGELLYALEYRGEAVTLPGGGELLVPSNLVIIGTMNSVDRSVALVDYALRRRFGFVRVDPQPDVVERLMGGTLLGDAGPVVLSKFNEWLMGRLGREHVLGHSYFLAPTLDRSSLESFDQIWSLDVRPLLEEYFFGEKDALREASQMWKEAVASALPEPDEAEPT